MANLALSGLPNLPPLPTLVVLGIGFTLFILFLTNLSLYLIVTDSPIDRQHSFPSISFGLQKPRRNTTSFLDDTERAQVEGELERHGLLSGSKTSDNDYSTLSTGHAADLNIFRTCKHGKRICHICVPCHSDQCSIFSASLASSSTSISELPFILDSVDTDDDLVNKPLTWEGTYPCVVESNLQTDEWDTIRLDDEHDRSTNNTVGERIEASLEGLRDWCSRWGGSKDRWSNYRERYENLERGETV